MFRGTPKSEAEFHPAVEPPRTRFIAEGQFGKLQIDAGIGLGDVDRLREHLEIVGDLVADLAVELTSFSYRQGLPREADLVFDVRFLANPYYVPQLKDRKSTRLNSSH